MINYFYSWKFNIPFPSLFQSCRKGEYGIKRSIFALSLVHYIKKVIVFQRKTRNSFSTLKTLHSKMNLDCCWKLPPINFDHIWWRIRSLGYFYSVNVILFVATYKMQFDKISFELKCVYHGLSQCTQFFRSSSSSDLLLVPRQASSLSKSYVQGLATTFMLVFGLVSLLDLIFSRISLTQALSFALDHDIRRRRQQRDLNDLEEVILRRL